MDAEEPFTDQDKKLAGEIIERGKGIVLLLNKWDLLGKKDSLGDSMKKKLRKKWSSFPMPLCISSQR